MRILSSLLSNRTIAILLAMVFCVQTSLAASAREAKNPDKVVSNKVESTKVAASNSDGSASPDTPVSSDDPKGDEDPSSGDAPSSDSDSSGSDSDASGSDSDSSGSDSDAPSSDSDSSGSDSDASSSDSDAPSSDSDSSGDQSPPNPGTADDRASIEDKGDAEVSADDPEEVGSEEFARAKKEKDEEGGDKPSYDSAVFKKTDGKPVVALVLGGGGGRGSGHVGVLKVLAKEGIPIDMVVGTSIGSVVGGFYAAGLPVEKIEEMFLDTSLMKAFMTVSLKVRVLAAPIMITPRLVGRHPYDGLYYGNKFRKFLLRQLPKEKRKIQNLDKKFAAIAVDLVSGDIKALTKGNIGYAMQASSAVPGLRKPVEIDGHLYVDGGISENVPVEQAKKLGADVIIAVNIDEYFEKVPLDHFRGVGTVSKRLVTLQLRNLDKPMVDQACVTIHPDVTGIGLLSTDADDAKRGIEAGEKAAREKLSEVKKCLRDAGIEI